jgi:ABC-type phosphate transport system auxiliary subunit
MTLSLSLQAYQAEFVAKEEAIQALNKEVEELQNALQQEARIPRMCMRDVDEQTPILALSRFLLA